MEKQRNMKYVETTTASVKMTGGVPFKGGLISDSSSEEEDSVQVKDCSKVHNRPPPANSLAERKSQKDSSIADNNVHVVTKSQNKESSRTGLQLDQEGKENGISSTPSNGLPLKSDSKIVGANKNDVQKKSNSILSQDSKNSTNTPNHLPSAKLKDSNDTCVSSEKSGLSVIARDNGANADNLDNKKNSTSNQPVNIPQRNVKKHKAVSSQNTDLSDSEDVSGFIAVKSSLSPKEQNWLRRSSLSLDNGQAEGLKEGQRGLVTSSSFTAVSAASHKEKNRHKRVNPFNNDLHVDEDHFSDTIENYFRTDRHSTCSTKSSSLSHDWGNTKSDVTFAELGLSEDHFSHPQGHFGLSGVEELELAIENCKELIKEAPQDSDKQKNLVLKLVQLRIKLQELKEGPEDVPENVKIILSHKMLLKTSRTSKYYCEKCNGSIWGMLQVWYRCTECGYRCHEKCLQQILRTCAKAKVLENPTLIYDICPKEPNGLASQSFRCAECRSPISFKAGQSEPRLCDYSGRYYCEFCHWNDTFIIPARVLHNWDFTPHKVCRASKQYLKLMQKKAVIRIQDINPMLFVYVDQLVEIKKLREEMMIMKKYILSCVSAMSGKLLLMLEQRQHFVESSDRYSMQDLLDAEDILLPELVNIHSTWAQHIKVDCQLCQGRGFCCELCGEEEILFPFDNIAVVCPKCSYVLHRHCYAKKCICPRCERREKRMTSKSEKQGQELVRHR